MKKKKAVTPPPVCELVQLELPIEPQTQNDGSQPPSKLPQPHPTSTAGGDAGATIYADDRIGMTAFHFTTYTALFAATLVTAYSAGQLPNEDAVRDFALEYAQYVFKWNYKHHKY